jgi:hypothetical protein
MEIEKKKEDDGTVKECNREEKKEKRNSPKLRRAGVLLYLEG